MHSSDKIYNWIQAGSKRASTNDTLTFTNEYDNPLLVLPLSVHNGLQYFSHDTPQPSPLFVRATLCYPATTTTAALIQDDDDDGLIVITSDTAIDETILASLANP
jgi:hypothetical protein